MTNKVQHYRSEVTSIVPATLLPGELAVNTTDKKIWSAGADGVPVEMTTVGPAGAEGPIGPEGPASVVPGPEGAVGPIGPDGIQGIPGADGADSVVPGPEGPIGVPGADGVDGEDSTVPGPQGPIGPDGIQGIQGVPGTTGSQGPAGTQILGVFGEITTPVDLPVDGLLPIDFDGPGRPATAYQFLDGESMTYQPAAGDTDPEWGDVYSWQTSFVAWMLLGKLAGPEGPVGPEGAQGVIGPDGAVGPAGPTAISVDAGNTAVLGTDSLIFVPTVGSGASMIVQETKPDEAAYAAGQEWLRTSDMTKFTLYIDVDSRQWVETSSAADSIVPGPVGQTGPIGPQGVQGDIGPAGELLPTGYKNVLLNPGFQVNQRGFDGNWAALAEGDIGYDRWKKVGTDIVQVIPSQSYLFSTEYTLSADGVVIETMTSPPSGAWTITMPNTSTKPQLEVGDKVTSTEKRPFGLEKSLCMFFFISGVKVGGSGFGDPGNTAGALMALNYSMYQEPTITYTEQGQYNTTGGIVYFGSKTATGVIMGKESINSDRVFWYGIISLDAEIM